MRDASRFATSVITRFILSALLVLACAILPARAAVTDGLVATYCFDEASGATAADSTRGSAGNGTLNNFGTTQWVTGKFGRAVDLDGVDDWISTPAAIANNATAMSFSGWVWADSRTTWASIAKNWGSTGQFHFGLNSADGRMSNYFINGTNVIDPTVFPTGSWQHVAFTYDGTTHRIYRNGAPVGSVTTTTSLPLSSNVVSLGCKANQAGTAPEGGSPGFWDGKFDDFGFWNRALSASEVAAIYNAGTQGSSLAQLGVPTIASFSASPSNIPSGGTTTLSWLAQNAASLTLNGGPIVNANVTGQTSIVTPALSADTTFTLTASNANGSIASTRLVGVGANVLEPALNEFLASNDTGIRDADVDGDHEDWIEIANPNASYWLDLGGYFLTTNAGKLNAWTIPNITLPPGGFLIVYASGKNFIAADGRIHTSFKLSTEGEYLALVKPNDATIVQQFSPVYPPQFADISYGSGGYLATPTPGAANSALLGPLISGVTENPPQPADGDTLTVQATLSPAAGATVTSAALIYRVMYGSEVSVPMTSGGGGVYSAAIPASASTPGQMVRWRVIATDSAERTSRAPLFRDPTNSPEYYGTVVQSPSVTSTLPILQRFAQDANAVDGNPGTRCSIFFAGEFFDNVGIRSRGNTSAAWPKKSHKVEMNSGHRFRFKAGVPRVTEFDLNTTYTDKAYTRAQMMSEFQRACGMVSPEVFPIRVQQNGAFYSVALFTENPDTELLARNGLDPNGAFYKGAGYSNLETSASYEKKTRRAEPGKADLDALVAALNLTGTSLETYLFDNVDLPSMVNYLATACIAQNIDGSDKNHFTYRDTNGSGEWTMLPWDLDLTFGPNALNTDTIVYDQNYASHPFIGARPYVLATGKYNRFLEAIVNTPRSRDMVIRRIRVLSDQFLVTGWFANRIDQLVPQLDAEVLLDHEKWGTSSHFGGSTYTLTTANDRIKNEYLTPRLGWLNSGGTVGIPASQPAAPQINFGAHDHNPASGNQDQEYVELINPNAFSVDVSGWTISGGIAHTLKPGTVLLPGSSIYLTPNPAAFRARATGPRGGQRLFVQGNVNGHLSNFGETVTLKNTVGATAATLSIPPDPSDAQRFLAISEVMYHPEPNGDAEFIELLNTSPSVTLNLAGVNFSAGISFTFPVGSTIAPLARVLVVKNTSVFQATYGTGLTIAGEFANSSSLSNSGERIVLNDATGSTICEFEYTDTAPWPVAADGGGSLVRIAPGTNPDPALSQNWRVSTSVQGNPGADDAVHFSGVANADDNGNSVANLIEYALGAPLSISSAMQGGQPAFTVHCVPNADDAEIIGQTSIDLLDWQPAVLQTATSTTRVYRAAPAQAGNSNVFFRTLVRQR